MTISKELLEELKEVLISDKNRIEGELDKITQKNQDGVREVNFPSDLSFKRNENANEVEEYVDRLAVEESLEEELKNINEALKRMEKGVYGLDIKTGEEINIERLRAYPAADTNV